MELDLITFLIVCPLVFLGGLVDAVAGGGGLIALPAYLIAGVPAHLFPGSSLWLAFSRHPHMPGSFLQSLAK